MKVEKRLMRFKISSFSPLKGALKVSARPFMVGWAKQVYPTMFKQESKPQTQSLCLHDKNLSSFVQSPKISLKKTWFILHRHQIPWGSVQNPIWHLWGKVLFLQSRNPLPDWCIFPKIHQENFTVWLKKSLPHKVLSSRRWSGDKIYQSHTLGFGSGSDTDHEEKKMLKLCPKADIFFSLFFFLMSFLGD